METEKRERTFSIFQEVLLYFFYEVTLARNSEYPFVGYSDFNNCKSRVLSYSHTKIKSAVLNTGRPYKTPLMPLQEGKLQAISYLNNFSDCHIRKMGVWGCMKSNLKVISFANGTIKFITSVF